MEDFKRHSLNSVYKKWGNILTSARHLAEEEFY